MKVALLEASHWHVPLYLDPLEASGIEVVAVSDAEQAKGQAIAARFGSTLYSSSNDLLDREEVDFAFVFGRHSEMPALAEAVIAAFAENPGAGTVGIGGVMYDRPHLTRAQRLLARVKNS